MRRLARPFSSFRRALQLSHVGIHILVEGREVDSYLYDRLAERSMPNPAEYRIVRADEISESSSGGKTLLLQLFEYLRHHKALSLPGRYAVLIVLDKDVDDLEHRCRRSQHVVYTPTYDAEGLVFRYGNLVEAVGAALSIQRSQVAFLQPAERWCDDAAGRWLDWVALCLCARQLGGQHPNYGSVSQVNVPLEGSTDSRKVGDMIKALAERSGVQLERVEALYRRLLAFVQRLHQAREIDRVFKGKWYADILVAEIRARRLMPRRPSVGVLQAAVSAALMTTIDYEAEWGSWFRERLRAVGATVGRSSSI